MRAKSEVYGEGEMFYANCQWIVFMLVYGEQKWPGTGINNTEHCVKNEQLIQEPLDEALAISNPKICKVRW